METKPSENIMTKKLAIAGYFKVKIFAAILSETFSFVGIFAVSYVLS